MDKNSFLRASQQKNNGCDSSASKKEGDGKQLTEADMMMAEIQKGIKFFNEKDEQDESIMLRESDKKLVDESMRLATGNMSFSFAVEAPIEMEHQHSLIGQGWKKSMMAKADGKQAKGGQQLNKR